MFDVLFDYTVGFLAVVGLIFLLIGAVFAHYEHVDKKKQQAELYK